MGEPYVTSSGNGVGTFKDRFRDTSDKLVLFNVDE